MRLLGMTKKIDNVAEVREGNSYRAFSALLEEDGTFSIVNPWSFLDSSEARDIDATLAAAVEGSEAPPFDWIALLPGALQLLPASSPAVFWLRTTGYWQQLTREEVAAEELRQRAQFREEAKVLLEKGEPCTWCGRVAKNHNHGKHMMPFCQIGKCESSYWEAS